MDVWIEGQRRRILPKRLLGKGGEAEVFDLGDGHALKIFKGPDHPDLAGQPEQQEAARQRLDAHQRKLPAFPAGLPTQVVAPQAIARASAGAQSAIVGYSMPLLEGTEPLLRWSEPGFRRAGASSNQVVNLFHSLRAVVASLHAGGIVIGDFNDLNVLVRPGAADCAEPFVIDTDSFQFGPFPCAVFTERFLDPRLRDPAGASPQLVRPYDPAADWFAFSALLTQSLLLLGPWAGIHRPPGGQQALPAVQRALRRHSILRGDVQLPKAALPLESLPDELLHDLSATFDRDERRPFPAELLARLRFTACATCGLEHARLACPRCRPHAGAPRHTVIQTRGKLVVTEVRASGGLLLSAAPSVNTVHTLVHEAGVYRREDASQVLAGPLDPRLRFALCAEATAVARDGRIALLGSRQPPRFLSCETAHGEPALAANEHHLAWVDEGRLLCTRPAAQATLLERGDQVLGEVLANRTWVGLGPAFGLTLSIAGGLTLASAFAPGRRGLAESPSRLPSLRGHVLSLRSSFSESRVALSLTLREQGLTRHHVLWFDAQARLLAHAESADGDTGWLGSSPAVCAAGGVLLAGTDDGLIRLEERGGSLAAAARFPETAAFVGSDTMLWARPDGILALQGNRLIRLNLH